MFPWVFKHGPRLVSLIVLAWVTTQCSGPRIILPQLSRVQHLAVEGIYPEDHESRLADDLLRAEHAWNALMATKNSSLDPKLREDYRRAVEGFIFHSQEVMPPSYWRNGKVFKNDRISYRVSFVDQRSAVEYPVNFFHELGQHKRFNTHAASGLSGDGIGAPMTGILFQTKKARAAYPLIPTNGARLAVTAVLEFTTPKNASAGSLRTVKLHLRDTFEDKNITLKGKKHALSFDYGTTLDEAFRSKYWLKLSLRGLFRPNETGDFTQFFRLRPHQPGRIPVVFIHGLYSDPHIWMRATKAIMADDRLREIYEPMCFAYATGLPVLENAAEFREAFRAGMRALDPEGDDPGVRDTILVGHSMGGLISRLQTIDSGRDFWNQYFVKPPEDLKLSPSSLRSIRSSLIFPANPDVTRAVYIATPHRGSKVAEMRIAQFFARLIRLPEQFLQSASELMTLNRDALNPDVIEYNMWPVSISTLSPQHPYFRALNARPARQPFHSIIARLGLGPLETSSDGVVSYESAHLEGAESEKIVNFWHGCVERPDVTEELVRILLLHAKESGYKIPKLPASQTSVRP